MSTQPEQDRESDRKRFPDEAFNRWLDEGISDSGHTVWDTVGDISSAWQAWSTRPFYDKAVEQEPVAWMLPDYGDVLSASEADGTGIYNIPLYTAPPKPEQWTPVEIGVDVTPEGAHVVGMYVLMPEAVRHVFYSKFHPAPKREWVGLTEDDMHTIRGDAFNKNVDDMNWAVAIARKIDFILRKRNT